MSVTAEQAFEARDIGEPVMISAYHAVKLIASHAAQPFAFFADRNQVMPGTRISRASSIPLSFQVDLADVLEWLGY